MGAFTATAPVTGGESIEFNYGAPGSDGYRRVTIREKANLTAGINSKPLVQRIPPHSRIVWSQIYNAQAMGYVGTDAVGTAASTNAANNVALFLSTISSYTGITAAATQSNANGIIQFLGTSTAAITSRGGVINATPLTNAGSFNWTYSTPGYLHLIPAANATSGHVLSMQTGTNGFKFFSTNTAVTNTAAVNVQIECETFGEMIV